MSLDDAQILAECPNDCYRLRFDVFEIETETLDNFVDGIPDECSKCGEPIDFHDSRDVTNAIL